MSDALLPPPSIRAVAQTLSDAGWRCWWAGESLARALEGQPSRAHTVWTNAPEPEIHRHVPDAVLVRRLPGSGTEPIDVPRRCEGGAHVDLLSLTPAEDADVDAAVARRCTQAPFTRRAIAVEVEPGQGDAALGAWSDPVGGRADVAAKRLAATGDAGARLAARPDLAVRAVRHLGEDQLELAPALLDALQGCKPDLHGRNVARVRAELRALLVGPSPAACLQALDRLGLAAALSARGTADAADAVDAIEPVLERRLVAWLRGSTASRALRQLRFGSPLAARVLVLLDHTPIDASEGASVEVTAARHLRRLSPDDLDFLIRLRRAELDALRTRGSGDGAAERRFERMLAALEVAERERAIEEARRTLVLSGTDVMERLGCGPGPRIGDALTHLSTQIVDGRCPNEAEALERELARYSAALAADE